jgi:hypothetical protein
MRAHSKPLEASFRTSTPSHESFASAATSNFTTASSMITPSTLTASSRPVSPSQSGSSDDDWNDTRSVPLGPRWQDYTYREGDSFYGGGTPKTATKPSVTGKPAPLAKHKSSAALRGTLQSVNGAASAVKSSIASTLRAKPVQPQITGFEVVRPTRVVEPEDQSEAID